eukprot:m51a1_g8224 putative dynein heavy chain axonemal (4742) ;mRNA; r:111319-133683
MQGICCCSEEENARMLTEALRRIVATYRSGLAWESAAIELLVSPIASQVVFPPNVHDPEPAQRAALGPLFLRPLPVVGKTFCPPLLGCLAGQHPRVRRPFYGERTSRTVRTVVDEDRDSRMSFGNTVVLIGGPGTGKTATVVDVASKHFVVYMSAAGLSADLPDPHYSSLARDVENIAATYDSMHPTNSSAPATPEEVWRYLQDRHHKVHEAARARIEADLVGRLLLLLALLRRDGCALSPVAFLDAQVRGVGAGAVQLAINAVWAATAGDVYNTQKLLRAVVERVVSAAEGRAAVVLACDDMQHARRLLRGYLMDREVAFHDGDHPLLDSSGTGIREYFRRDFTSALALTLASYGLTCVLRSSPELGVAPSYHIKIGVKSPIDWITVFPPPEDPWALLGLLINTRGCTLSPQQLQALGSSHKLVCCVVAKLLAQRDTIADRQQRLNYAIHEAIDEHAQSVLVSVFRGWTVAELPFLAEYKRQLPEWCQDAVVDFNAVSGNNVIVRIDAQRLQEFFYTGSNPTAFLDAQASSVGAGTVQLAIDAVWAATAGNGVADPEDPCARLGLLVDTRGYTVSRQGRKPLGSSHKLVCNIVAKLMAQRDTTADKQQRLDCAIRLPTLGTQQGATTAAPRERGWYSETLHMGVPPPSAVVQQIVATPVTSKEEKPGSPSRKINSSGSGRTKSPSPPGSPQRRLEPIGGSPRTGSTLANLEKMIEPKVMVAFSTPAGKTPRKVAIERKKRKFAELEIGKLLHDEGLHKAFDKEPGRLLGCVPLELFDDSEYDTKNPEEWLSLVVALLAPEGTQPSVSGSWVPVEVTDYDPATRAYQVTRPPKPAAWVSKLRLLFAAEDPLVHVERVRAAAAARGHAEAALQYRCYVDSMPHDEAPPLARKHMGAALQVAIAPAKYGHLRAHARPAVQEAVREYSWVLNKLSFDATLETELGDAVRSTLGETEDPFAPAVFARTPVRESELCADFGARQADFVFRTFLTRPETITVILKIRSESLQLLQPQNDMFTTRITKSVRLEEFETMQISTFTNVGISVRDQYVNLIKNAVTNSLRGLGKGWFNLEETSREVYEISKLKKLFEYIRFMMEDTLRFLTEGSLENLADFLEMAADDAVTVTDTDDVDVKRSMRAREVLRFPLFIVDLMVKDKTIVLSTPCEAFEEKLDTICEKMLGVFANITTIERQVMKNLFWSHIPVLGIVGKSDPRIDSALKRIRAAIATALKPLVQYMKLYDKYKEFLGMDTTAYLEAFKSTEHSLDEFKEEILKHVGARDEIESRIPSSVSVGMFLVNNVAVLQALSEKYRSLASGVLDVLTQKTHGNAMDIHREFDVLKRRLEERNTTIEMLNDQKTLLTQVPGLVKALQRQVDGLGEYYEMLDEMLHPISNEHLNLRWDLIGWPDRILKRMDETVAVQDRDRSVFYKQYVENREQFEEKIGQLSKSANAVMRVSELSQHDKVVVQINSVLSQIKEAQEMIKVFNRREKLFGIEQTSYPEFNTVIKQLEPYTKLWQTAHDWIVSYDAWMSASFASLKIEQIEDLMNNGGKTMYKLGEYFKSSRSFAQIAHQIRDQIEAFRPHMPLITALRDSSMRPRHLDMLQNEMHIDLKFDDSMTLSTMLTLGLEEKLPYIQKITELAGKEYIIEAALAKIEREWQSASFDVRPYRSPGTYVIRATDDISQMLDDHLVTIQTMGFSAYKAPFESQIALWEDKLRIVLNCLDEWLYCQRQWLSLEPIFGSEDISRQLPTEGKRWITADRIWRHIMSNTKANPQVLVMASQKKTLEDLTECHKLLDQIQFGLSEYLATKQAAFPRFYFLSNNGLLEILSQTKDPTAVQPHLHKCFENISSLVFVGEKHEVTAMQSAEGEEIKFLAPITPTVFVENWLLEVEFQMRQSIRAVLIDALKDFVPEKRMDWIRKWPGQVVLAGNSLFWTRGVTEAIRKGMDALKVYHDQLLEGLKDLTKMVQMELTTLEKLTLGALIVMDIHQRDVVAALIKANVETEQAYEWVCQLRTYWESDNLVVKMVNSALNYGYEYLGNTTRLVITPLTDKCYLTLTGALNLQLGGAPQGPAGTGKTETSKDLAKAIAKQCVVFNCSDGLTNQAMGKFFKGVASSGAWACLDEFNRIELEVLSVVAEQIGAIQRAMHANLRTFMLADTVISLDKTAGIFITMNPGYAGRTELPDNLKALFRPVTMMVPDFAMIAEIKLVSFGFTNSRILASKMVATFKLSSEQLSAQDHYDFGTRALNAVIRTAGSLKGQYPHMDEQLILLRALRDCNIPKFLAQDIPLFEGILSDLFPGLSLPSIDYGELIPCLMESIRKFGFQPVPTFITKVLQMYDTMLVRHGLMLVGLTGSGKTGLYRCLMSALNMMNKADAVKNPGVRMSVLNPKAITSGQLYGEMNKTTLEWTEGVLAVIIREDAADRSPIRKWIICDGPVDAMWIENMNSLLDDNKKLCLTNGEIITFNPTQTIIFEVDDLSSASLATVTRCGMIYMEPSELGVDAIIKSGLQRLPQCIAAEHMPTIERLFEQYLAPSLRVLRAGGVTELAKTTDIHLARSLLNMFECMLDQWIPPPDDYTDLAKARMNDVGEVVPLEAAFITPLFVFSLIWSVGATVDHVGRIEFDKRLRQLMHENATEPELPPDDLVYDYRYDLGEKKWVHWMRDVSTAISVKESDFSQLIVPTVDTVRSAALMEILLRRSKQILFVGPTGTGKSVVVKNKLLSGLSDKFQAVMLNFTGQSTANQTQDIIEGKFDLRRKGVLGPSAGHKLVIFVDDVHMPKKETSGAQPAVELLRQFLDHGGWYDLKALQTQTQPFKEIVNTTLVCAMTPPGGPRPPVSARFLRHFNVLGFPRLSDGTLLHIFRTILGAFLQPFKAEVREAVDNVVKATIDVYNTCMAELLPTPSKSHYMFNMRDLSKVFQGLMSASPQYVVTPQELACLWLHECSRAFEDRLVDRTDRKWFRKILKSSLSNHLNMTTEIIPSKPLIYGDILDRNMDVESRVYRRIEGVQTITTAVYDALEYYNQTSQTQMRLVLFMDCIEHISHISRILRQPQGNALLLGMGGSGRKSCTMLAASLAQCDVVQIDVTDKYGAEEWHEDLKKVMKMAGLEKKNVVFMIDDAQIRDESFLEDVNNILNSGDVPNLWASDELDFIYSQITPLMESTGKAISKESIYNFFIGIVKRHIHVVLCLSPIGEQFYERIRLFPSLVACCTIDWFSGWPDEALVSVAQSVLAPVNMTDSQRDIVTRMCAFMFRSVERASLAYKAELNRQNYVTPTSFLEMLGLFKELLALKRLELEKTVRRLTLGLEKLASAASDVSVLQDDLRAAQPLLEKATQDLEEVMHQLDRETASVDEVRKKVKQDEAEVELKAAERRVIAEDAQRELDEALPALEAAVAGLNSLNRNDITEVRSMVRPPAGVKLVMEAICIMKSAKPKKIEAAKPGGPPQYDYWDSAKLMLNDPEFLKSLHTFDKDNIPDAVIQKLQPYIQSEEFRPYAISKVSKACTSLCIWVRAMERYYHVAKAVAPKRERLEQAEQAAAEMNAKLAATKRNLQEIEERLAELCNQKDMKAKERADYQQKVSDCEVKLDRAHKLLDALAEERRRWEDGSRGAKERLESLVGDAVISAGSIAYTGVFTGHFRQRLLREWQEEIERSGIEHTPRCTMRSTMGDPFKERQMIIDGLPSDSISLENALIVFNSRRWPLIIDPQGQANKWIKKLEKDHGLDVVKLTQDDFMRTLENAIRFGKPVLIENIGEDIDPSLNPVLLKQTVKQTGGLFIKFGDSLIPYHDDFKLYMTTKLPNPVYKPEISTKVTLINFTITNEGLHDQLLGLVVSRERPDLEESKNQLVVLNTSMRTQLREVEDKMLQLLSDSSGNPLEDLSLINALSEAKKTSATLKVKMAESEENEKSIDQARQQFDCVASSATVLFFAVMDLSLIDPMYQYSLGWFINLFVNGMKMAEPAESLPVRLENLSAYFKYSLYCNVCRSLFVKHKLLFSFILCIRFMQSKKQIDAMQWRFLLAGGAAIAGKLEKVANPFSWLEEKSWNELVSLSQLSGLTGIHEAMAEVPELLKKYYESQTPFQEKLPEPWNTNLTTLEKMLILRCLRPDALIGAIQLFITQHLGSKFAEPPDFDLSGAFKDSASNIPLIFVLSTGADPQAELMRFAEEMRFARKLEAVSLGQGQGPRAEAAMKDCMEKGFWVLLQNCHLAESWMPTLEKMVEAVTPEKVHKDFRLWLTSMPTAKFPISVLQNGIKLTIEPPRGIKANMIRSYSTFDDSFLASVTGTKNHAWKRLLFNLCFVHSVILERRKFGPLGWNVAYEFTSGDLNVCVKQLKIFMTDYEDIPWKMLRFLAGNINYGGRVTDPWDQRTLNTLISTFYTEASIEPERYPLTPSGTYVSPADGTMREYMAHLRRFPIDDGPEAFGMHDNADLSYRQASIRALFDDILVLEASSSSGGSSEAASIREAFIRDVASDILAKMPESVPLDKPLVIKPRDSMGLVLVQEVKRYDSLLVVIRNSLKELISAYRGLVVMSKALEQMANNIYDNQVPMLWSSKGYPSLLPLRTWVEDLQARLKFLSKWANEGAPAVFWFSGLFFPQAFLTGVLQSFARRYHVSIDTVAFNFIIMDKPLEAITKGPDDGVYIYGLFIEGARYDPTRRVLAESQPRKLYQPLPVMWLKPVQNRVVPETGVYRCPVYKTLTRAGLLSSTGYSTNMVVTIELPTEQPESHWIKRGVASFCTLAS